MTMRSVLVIGIVVGAAACHGKPDAGRRGPEASPVAPTAAAATSASSSVAAPNPSVSQEPRTEAQAVEPVCPRGMLRIAGGEFWAGNERSHGNPEERPRFLTRVHDVCLDRTEVTTQAYDDCVAGGACTSAKRETSTCNSGRDREDHPINCVSYGQAEAYCKAKQARLPTELEWEYAARGGSEYRKFSWGEDHPDGKTCWKRARSCPVGMHAEGAYGLHDMNGNVWEWTSTWFGPYPWPLAEGSARVNRGGSWSRRFEKWMSLTLRNRLDPKESGSHLGFRCAALPSDVSCPYGREGDTCRHGVDDVECAAGRTFNGARCVRPGEPQCANDENFEPGRGCVGSDGLPSRRQSSSQSATRATESAVAARRDPKFDDDCARFNPARPHAWRFEGGSHGARNNEGNGRGCKNRDVGVGWNSACCP